MLWLVVRQGENLSGISFKRLKNLDLVEKYENNKIFSQHDAQVILNTERNT